MKLTRSLPANAMASENVPISTITLSTLTFRKCSNCISSVKIRKQPPMIIEVWLLIHPLSYGVMNDRSFIPLISSK